LKQLYLIAFLLLFSLVSFSQKSLGEFAGASEKTNVRFFPNPASTTITFEFNAVAEKGYNIRIYSFLGRQVLALPVTGSRISVNVTDLMKGVYVFQVRDASGRIVATNKFQVSR
jgi:hypothetical protein